MDDELCTVVEAISGAEALDRHNADRLFALTTQQGRGLSDFPLCRCETAEPTGCLAASADNTQAEPWEHSPGVGG